ncbi:MAG: hypothetical protein ABC578_06390, partial [Candidatus Methanosuratincola petrocarbonis]
MSASKKLYQERRSFKQTRNGTVPPRSTGTVLEEFLKFCKVDLHLKPSSIKSKKVYVSRMLREVGADPTVEELRDFLASFENPSSYNNCVKALRLYFRDFLGDCERIRTFRFCRVDYGIMRLYSKKELREFFCELDTERERALFLMYATSGRRRSEILDLRVSDLRIEDRTIMPGASS